MTRTPTPAPAGTTLLRVEEVAHELRAGVSTVYRLIAGGAIAVRRIGGKTLVHRDDLAAYLRAVREVHAPREAAPAPTRETISLREAGLIDEKYRDVNAYRPRRKG